MKIFVLVKQVPDTETHIRINDKKIDESGVKWIVSPFDEHALEESLRLREKTGGEITALSLGPERVTEALRTALALGVDRAIHIMDENFNPLHISFSATVLGRFLKEEKADIILTGHTAIDSQSSMVPSMLAEYLGCSAINSAVEVNIEGEKKIICKREVENGTAIMESETPVVISATKSLNDPRYPSLKGIMASKKKKIEVKSVAEVLGDTVVPNLEILSMEMPPDRPPGRIIDAATPEEKAAELMKLLREEAKVI